MTMGRFDYLGMRNRKGFEKSGKENHQIST
jgi:hypothetical protein